LSTEQAELTVAGGSPNSRGHPRLAHKRSGPSHYWIAPIREATRRQAIDAHRTVADLLADRDPAAAIAVIDQAIGHDPYNETFYQHAMRLHAAHRALPAVAARRNRLVRELADIGTSPTPQTLQLADDLLADPPTPHADITPTSVMSRQPLFIRATCQRTPQPRTVPAARSGSTSGNRSNSCTRERRVPCGTGDGSRFSADDRQPPDALPAPQGYPQPPPQLSRTSAAHGTLTKPP
jgi:DNA-binding SARP family transcriptional activator